MRIPRPRRDRGIALIIVMMVIIVFSVLAGGFAYAMKVETKLARNTSWESDMEWLGRSGVELGKYSLATYLMSPPPENSYTALSQVWAGGPFNHTNEIVNVALTGVEIGAGKVSVKIIDLERKFSLATVTEANPVILENALMMVGADSADIPTIIDSYFDWVDLDKKTELEGAENQFYLNLPPPHSPHYAKDGPVDDMRELLLLKGMNEQIFWGTARLGVATDRRDKSGRPLRMQRSMSASVQTMPPQESGVGLIDLFVPMHGGGPRVNINTASSEVLQLIPGLDKPLADSIVANRSAEPYRNPQEALMQGGADPIMVASLTPMLGVHSRHFEITVDAEIGNHKRKFIAVVERRSARDVITLYFTWK